MWVWGQEFSVGCLGWLLASLFLKQGLLPTLWLSNWLDWLHSKLQGSTAPYPVPSLPPLELQICMSMPGLSTWVPGSNSGSHACLADTSVTKLPPQHQTLSWQPDFNQLLIIQITLPIYIIRNHKTQLTEHFFLLLQIQGFDSDFWSQKHSWLWHGPLSPHSASLLLSWPRFTLGKVPWWSRKWSWLLSRKPCPLCSCNQAGGSD